MHLRKVSGCEKGVCPAVYVSDRQTAVVQGEHVAQAEGLSLGPGEMAVELPPEVVLEAVQALAGASADPAVTERLREVLAC